MANPKGHIETLIPGQGRPKGVKNKFTNLKDAFIDAFGELGGAEGLIEWAKGDKKNLTTFYQILARMLPQEVKADLSHQLDWRAILEAYINNGNGHDRTPNPDRDKPVMPDGR